jgi:hypothetical protein
MHMQVWRSFEFRGRDRHGNAFVDFGFVAVEEQRLALTSHMLRQPLWVGDPEQVLPTFKNYYEAAGFAQLRYKILWQEGSPVDTPFAEGWEDL